MSDTRRGLAASSALPATAGKKIILILMIKFIHHKGKFKRSNLSENTTKRSKNNPYSTVYQTQGAITNVASYVRQ
jgi:hypothetical protein